MKRLLDTEIEFGNLKTGSYDFDFKLDAPFFASFGNEKLQGGEAFFHVRMEKREHGMTLFLSFSGHVQTLCDRCLGEMELPVQGEEALNVRLAADDEDAQRGQAGGGAAMDDTVLPPNAHKMDLAQLFYEMVAVAMPMQCVHADDENGRPACDPNMLKYMVGDNEQTRSHEETEPDPRWAALQQLKENK